MRHEAFPLRMCIVASGRLSLHPSPDRMQMRHLFKNSNMSHFHFSDDR